ncbi:hypothetical protein KAR91_78635 [Candidatus Pacearchaeota archaeon]|nr:hypothetical protein [Candidatus Pacearchaeota archaeon]
MVKRLITEKQEQALRLCHQDFDGLSQTEAAEKMGISEAALGKLLARVEKVLPQYFPMLTKLEAKCYHHYMNEGWPVNEITECTGQSESAVYKALQRARDKGMRFTESKDRVLQYDSSMDGDIKEQF